MSVIVPWWPSPERESLLRLVREHFAGWKLILGQGSSRAEAINEGVRQADTPAVIVNDADTLVPLEQVNKAMYLALTEPGLVIAYRGYFRLTRRMTETLCEKGRVGIFDRDSDWDSDWFMADAPSLGCMAIRRDCFEQVGGFDERFTGWGYEDAAFRAACERLWPTRRVEGDLYHLWHGGRRADDSPLDSDPEAVARNLALYEAEYARG